MTNPIYFDQICPNLPIIDPADQAVRNDFAKTFTQKWPESTLSQSGYGPDDLAAMLVTSQYLQRLALRHGEDVGPCLNGQAANQINVAKTHFITSMQSAGDEKAALQAIRIWRGRTALMVALSDLAGHEDIPKQMEWLSEAAQTVLSATIQYLFRQAAQRGKIKSFDADLSGCGWTVLALGKLGAGELNFSSDIDLIILHDTHHAPFDNLDAVQPFFVTMTRDLIRLLSSSTSDGIGWRVDLRLRPDPGATAVSIDLTAAISYYESIARTWERAAFIRARPVAGDLALGNIFLRQIQPFIWRKTLDYTVMDDMKTMLRRPPQGNSWRGYNLKTGKNGIRQIEFFTHVLQLVAGGRDEKLRHRNSLAALDALAATKWINSEQAAALGTAYHQLRRIEHRLQMIADNQTHSLPRGQEDLEKFAHFMGHRTAADFCDRLNNLLDQVGTNAKHDLLNPADSTISPADGIKDILLDDHDALAGWLGNHGFERPRIIADTLSGWMAGRISATRSDRARALLNRLMPEILMTFTAADAPDDKFAALAQFIEGLPASVQIFSLLDYNRQLTRLLCDIVLLSPQLGNHLRQYPTLFDLLLYQSFFKPLLDANMMTAQLEQICSGRDIEDALDQIKIKAREWKFQVEIQALSQTIDSTRLATGLSAIATATVRLILNLARADMTRRHGEIDGSVTILALGRLGTGQMTVSSDLDLLFVYDSPETALSEGKRAINAPTYFARLAQTMVSWLSTATAEGVLYQVDLRLRPEGEAGAIATSLDRLKTYFAADAWIWEKLALAKAQPIAGDANLTKKLRRAINAIVNQPHDHSLIGPAIDNMLVRIRKVRKGKSKWHLRARDGGLIELDLLMQGMRLQHGYLFDQTGQSIAAILAQLKTSGKINANHAEALQDADQLFNEIHQCLRLTFGNAASVPDQLPTPLQQFMLSRMDLADEQQLTVLFETTLETVSAILNQYLANDRTISA
jgi:glutamate-ammonia-ligase adenylyltransferase